MAAFIKKKLSMFTIGSFALITFITLTAACSSRSPPKQRPEYTEMPEEDITPTTTQRPNITFPIFSCPPTYAAWYCLNEATCFTVEIHNEIFYNCECAVGFVGPRCEFKEIDGSYLPTRPRIMLEKASILSGATFALLLVVFFCILLYIHHEKKLKIKLNGSSIAAAHANEGMDEVDGITKITEMRPFGPHHYTVLPLAAAFKR